ncbi:MAG: AhpA/YtjB family protein [Pseudomonadota bacterium]
MQIQIQQNFAIFKRISSAILIILVGILSVNLWKMQIQSATQWYEFESEQLGRSLTRQAAKLVSPSMQSSDQVVLETYIDKITDDDFIQATIIFTAEGIRINQQDESPSVVNMVSQTEYRPLIFVEDIIDDNGEILGYIKLILDREHVTHHHRIFVDNQLTQTVITMILTFIIAALITRLFYKFRYRHMISDEQEMS